MAAWRQQETGCGPLESLAEGAEICRGARKGFEVSSAGVAKGLVAASTGGEPEGGPASSAGAAALAELPALAAELLCSCISSAGMWLTCAETSAPSESFTVY